MSTKLSIEKIINHRYNRSLKTLSSAYKFLSYIKAGSKLKEGNKYSKNNKCIFNQWCNQKLFWSSDFKNTKAHNYKCYSIKRKTDTHYRNYKRFKIGVSHYKYEHKENRLDCSNKHCNRERWNSKVIWLCLTVYKMGKENNKKCTNYIENNINHISNLPWQSSL